MSRDSSFNYLHLHAAHHADLLESFTSSSTTASATKLLANEEISVAHQHRPVNPEDEDDVIPDQHAAFGIQRATQRQREPAWRDLGLERLMFSGPPQSNGMGGGGGGIGAVGSGGQQASPGAVRSGGSVR